MISGLMKIVKKHINKILFLGIFLFVSFHLFDNYQKHNFNIDEYLFIKKSYYFDLFFIKHDLSDPRWFIVALGDDVTQPKVGPYIYGITLHLAGISNIEEFFRKTNFTSITVDNQPWWSILWNAKPENFPKSLSASLKLIWLGRRTSILFGIGSAIILFIFGTNLVNTFFASIASVLLVTNNLFTNEMKYATTDSMQLFFFFSNLLLCHIWLESYKNKNKKSFVLYSLILGINAALAAGTKTSGILVCIFLGIFILLVMLIMKFSKRSIQWILVGTFIIGMTCGVVFYSLHPFVHVDTLEAIKKMYYTRTLGYKDYWTEYPPLAIYTRKDSLLYIFQRTLAADGDFINFYLNPIPVDLILFLSGFVLISVKSFQQWKNKKKFPRLSILPLWSVVVFIGLIFYLFNDWPRYYLPFVSCITVVEGYAICMGLQRFYEVIVQGNIKKNSA